MTTVKEAIEHLQQYLKPTDHVAISIWSIEDVQDQAKERKIKISKRKAEELLDDLDRHQDASIGINWDTINAYLDEYGEK